MSINKAKANKPGQQPKKAKKAKKAKPEPTGLGGWFILIAVIVVVTATSSMDTIMANHGPLANPDDWDLNFPAEHQQSIRTILAIEYVGNLLTFLIAAPLILLMVTKSRLFKSGFYLMMTASLATSVAVTVMARLWIGDLMGPVMADAIVIALQFALAAICVTYLRRSRRVRNTFKKRTRSKKTLPIKAANDPAVTAAENISTQGK